MLTSTLNKIDNWKYKGALLLSFSILIKLLYLFIIALYFDDSKNGHLYNDIQGDNVTYKSFCENLFQLGEYFTKTGESLDYTFRMPGMAFLYIPIRLFVDKDTAVDVFLIIQTIFSGLAAYYLAVLAANILKKRKLFYIVYFITLFGFLIPLYNNMFMTESLALSTMIMGVYYFHKAIQENNYRFYFISGFFLTWMIFLRPFMLFFFICIIFYLIYIYFNKNLSFKIIIIFLSSFILIDGVWTIRNFVKINKFLPLQSSSSWIESCPESHKLRLKFQQDFGFRAEPWAYQSQSGWFEDTIKEFDKNYLNKIFPERTFNGKLTMDSLKKLKVFCQSVWSKELTEQKRNYFDKKASRLLNKFTFELKKNRPMDYYIFNRIRIVNNFLSENLFCALVPLKYPFNVLGVFGDSFSNYFLKLFGFIGLILILLKFRKNNLILLLILSVPIFIMLYFPIYSRLDESRFFVMAAPFLMICAGYLLLYISQIKYGIIILLALLITPIFLSFQILFDKINF